MRERTSQDSELVRNLVFEINRISTAMRKHPTSLGKNEFLEAVDNRFTEWDLRKMGGFKAILDTYFCYDNKDMKTIEAHKNHLRYVRRLEKQVGNMESYQEKVAARVAEVLSGMTLKVNKLDPAETKKYLSGLKSEDQGPKHRSVVTIWSDQHFGTNVFSDEMGGKNAFNWQIGARRLGKLCEQIATYKVEKRAFHEELVILLLGDNIGGIIHNQEGPDFDLMIHQINGAAHYYRQAVDYLRNFFPKVRLVCQTGNHGRVMHKSSKDRAMNQKYDSFEMAIFNNISSAFRHDPNVLFETTRAPFSDVTIQGRRVYATHGDTVFMTGNVGQSVRIAKLEEQVNKINAEELRMGRRPYELVAVGHVHHPMVTELPSGVKIAVNGCLIGSDPYALGVGVHSSNPAQLVWEATDKHVLGDLRVINLADADSITRYDKVISAYTGELTVEKEDKWILKEAA